MLWTRCKCLMVGFMPVIRMGTQAVKCSRRLSLIGRSDTADQRKMAKEAPLLIGGAAQYEAGVETPAEG